MKKSGRSHGSKKTRERKHIEIKQSREISPVKQVTEPEDSKALIRQERNPRLHVPPLPAKINEFTNQELQSLSSHADALLSVELMKSIIQKQEETLSQFYATCPPIFKTAFDRAIKNAEQSMNIIREERIERMKQQTVMFIPPDKDNFEKQKGKTLDNWIKQQLEVHQQRKNFPDIFQTHTEVFRETEVKISKLAIDVPKQKIQPGLQQISRGVEQKNRHEIESRLNGLKNELRDILEAVDDMRRLKEQKMEEQRRIQCKKQLCCEGYLKQRFPTYSMALFSVQDYLI